MRVEMAIDGRGREVVYKTAENPEEAARLRREADLLEVAAHPGVVELVAFEEAPEEAPAPRLCTSRVGDGRTAAVCQPIQTDEVAGIVAALASTLADLHAMSLVHGALAPEHVILDEDGRPVLCSLGYGGLAGERAATVPNPDTAFVDPAAAGDTTLDATADVYGIGALLAYLLDCVEGQGRRGPVEALSRLVQAATVPERTSRPTAGRLADQIHAAVPAARLPPRVPRLPHVPRRPEDARVVPRPDPLEGRRRQRPLEGWRRAQLDVPRLRRPPRRRLARRPLLLGGLLVLLTGFGVAVVGRQAQAPRAGAARAPAPPAPPVNGDVRPPTGQLAGDHQPPVTRSVPAGCPLLTASLSADVDGDGCAEPMRHADGVIEAGSLRWTVGQAEDVAVTGDWSCAGKRSLAILRPTTGEVFAFDGWATADRAVHARLLAQVKGGRTLRPADLDGDGCHELVVEGAAAPTVLRPAKAP